MRIWPVWLLVAVCAGTATADGPGAPADAKATAKAHAATGTQLFNVQQYDKAAEEYQQAYLLDPDPAYLYASAQAQRLGGNCVKALLSYKAYLRTKPGDDKAEKNIERCEQELKDHPPPVEQTTPTGPTNIAPVPPAPAAPPVMITRPWTSDVVGHVLVGGGVAASVVGVVLYLGGRSTISDHNSATTYDQFAGGNVNTAKTKQTIGVSAMAAGGALILGGVIHYVMHGRPVAERTVTADITSSGATLALTGTF
jgi:tetratricopeptide (TPR) repeat protein